MADLVFFYRYLYRALRLRLVLWLAFMVAAALLEGLSVALFLPILGDVGQESPLTRQITRAFEAVGLKYSLSWVLLFIVVFFLLRSVFMVFGERYAQRLIMNLAVGLKRNLIDKLFAADYLYFLRNEIGYYTNALTIEYSRVAFAFQSCLKLVVSAGFALVYLALPLAVNPLVAGALVVLAVPGYFVVSKMNKLTRGYSLQLVGANSRLSSYLIQSLVNFKYLKATNSGTNIVQKTQGVAQQQGELQYKQAVLSMLMTQGTQLLLVILIAGLLFVNVVLLDLELMSVLFLLFLTRRAITFALATYEDYRKFLGVSGSIKVFRQLERELDENREDFRPGGSTPDFGQPIVLKGVGFSYERGKQVLKKLNFEIPPLRTVAIVGASGEGKSTLVTLLTGILKPSEGALYLGNVDYRDLDQASLRRGIGYVTQESVMFNDTIRNNITLWSDSADEEEVRTAASQAHLAEFIGDLPHAYDTQMGDGGHNVSGGQRQRISIARELFKDAKLLIFDEATSALDSRSEREVQANIDEFQGQKTVVVIAHRLSTVKNSDLIFVLREGEVVESGPYEELYALGGEFTSMVDQQALTIERDPQRSVASRVAPFGDGRKESPRGEELGE